MIGRQPTDSDRKEGRKVPLETVDAVATNADAGGAGKMPVPYLVI
jgi:hypothetical protein